MVDSPITIALDLPPKEIHPNGRGHQRAKDRLRAEYRRGSAEISRAAVFEHGASGISEAVVGLRYWFATPTRSKTGRRLSGAAAKVKRHDPDNLIAWAKTAIDAMQDAGVLKDDRALIYLPPQQCIDDERPRLEVVIFREHPWLIDLGWTDGWNQPNGRK